MEEDAKLSAVTSPEYLEKMLRDEKWRRESLPKMLTADMIKEYKSIIPSLPSPDIRDYYDSWAKHKGLATMMKKGTPSTKGTDFSPWLYIRESGGVSDAEMNKLAPWRRNKK